MARRKNVKRIDPRYFLNETVNRGEEEIEEELEEGLFPKGSVASWGEKWVTDKAKSAGSAIAGAFKGKKEEPAPDPQSDEGRFLAGWRWLVKGGPTGFDPRFTLYYMTREDVKDVNQGRAQRIYMNNLEKLRQDVADRRAKGETHQIPDEEKIHKIALDRLSDWADREEKQARQRSPERKAQIAAKYEKEDAERAEEKRRRDGGRAKKHRPRNPSASQIAGAAMRGEFEE